MIGSLQFLFTGTKGQSLNLFQNDDTPVHNAKSMQTIFFFYYYYLARLKRKNSILDLHFLCITADLLSVWRLMWYFYHIALPDRHYYFSAEKAQSDCISSSPSMQMSQPWYGQQGHKNPGLKRGAVWAGRLVGREAVWRRMRRRANAVISPLSVRQWVIAGWWWQLQRCGVMSPSSQQDWVCVQQVGSGACHLLLSHLDASFPAEEWVTDAWCVLGIKPGLCFIRGASEKLPGTLRLSIKHGGVGSKQGNNRWKQMFCCCLFKQTGVMPERGGYRFLITKGRLNKKQHPIKINWQDAVLKKR